MSEKVSRKCRGVMKERFLKNIREKLDKGAFGRDDSIKEAKEKFKIKSLRTRRRPKKEEK